MQLFLAVKRIMSAHISPYTRYLLKKWMLFDKKKNYKIIRNYYNTNFKKNVLISYILEPFMKKDVPLTHTNLQEAKKIGLYFNKREYNVDIIEYSYKKDLNPARYDVIFGFGRCFDQMVKNSEGNLISIAYLTGSNIYFSNVAEFMRMKQFSLRNYGKVLRLHRQLGTEAGLMDLNAILKMDAAICVGNDQSCSTWKDFFKCIYKVPVSGFSKVMYPEINRDIVVAKHSFLWFGGGGMLHKGLDICLEAFRELDDINLYVAGPPDLDFIKFYSADLKRENIHYVGFLNVNSAEYAEICRKCMFILLPSCSEGQATSVVTAMFTGLIPVVTKECGINLCDFGFEIESTDVQVFRQFIAKLTQRSEMELEQRQKQAYEYVMNHNSLKIFEEQFEIAADKILCNLSPKT